MTYESILDRLTSVRSCEKIAFSWDIYSSVYVHVYKNNVWVTKDLSKFKLSNHSTNEDLAYLAIDIMHSITHSL